MQSVINANENPTAQADDRDARGRFKPGNAGGPGNPFGGQAAFLRQTVIECVTKEDIQGIVRRLVTMAQDGHWQAAKLILTYVFGKPQSMSMSTQLEDMVATMSAEVEPAESVIPTPSANLEIPDAPPSPNGDFQEAPPSPNGDFQEAPPSPNGTSVPPMNRKQRRAARKALRNAFKTERKTAPIGIS